MNRSGIPDLRENFSDRMQFGIDHLQTDLRTDRFLEVRIDRLNEVKPFCEKRASPVEGVRCHEFRVLKAAASILGPAQAVLADPHHFKLSDRGHALAKVNGQPSCLLQDPLT